MPTLHPGRPSGSIESPESLPTGITIQIYVRAEPVPLGRIVKSATVEISGDDGYYKKLVLNVGSSVAMDGVYYYCSANWTLSSKMGVLYRFDWKAVDDAGITGTLTTYGKTPAPPPPIPKPTLTVTAMPGGTTNPAPGQYSYDQGRTASVTAIPSGGYVFDHWNLDAVNVGASNPISVSMNNDHTLEAVFTVAPPVLIALKTLTITATVGGTTNPAPGQYEYAEGSLASVTAITQIAYVFDHWNLDAVNVGASNPISVSMNNDHTLEAVFTYPSGLPTLPPVVTPPSRVEIIPVAPTPPSPTVIPPAPAAPPVPITPETATLIVLGALAVVTVIGIGVAIWYFSKPP